MKKVTLKDIAIETGYSVNTVSHAIRDKEDIKKETREIIKAKAKEMGYISNSLAGALRSGYSGVIAILISDIINPYVSIIAKEIQDQLFDKNYSVLILNTDENEEKERKAIELALGRQVDGIILCPAQHTEDNIRFLCQTNIPVVLLGRRFPCLDTDYVILDDFSGAYQVTEYLLRKGHRKILCLSGPLYVSVCAEKYRGYRKALEDYGVTFQERDLMILPNSIELPGEDKMLERIIGYDAIFAANDVMALYIAEILMEHPELPDVELFGYDNIQSRLHLPYKLNTVNTAKEQMAKKTCEFLLNRIQNRAIGKQHCVIDTSLCIRA